MPDRLSYDEAMQYSHKCLKIQDPDLRQGSVETYSIKTSVGEIKKPWGIEGGFAVVYKFRTHSGKMKAMRCFRVSMNPDTKSRYEKMSVYFRKHIPEITIDFRYYKDGILVKESAFASEKKVCPVIIMEWVEGVTLLEKVDELCKRRDTQALQLLADRWIEVINTMRLAHIAHGDLAGVNVMVRSNGKLALVDYDGVYIPEFKGLSQVVLGQQGYQHPDMAERPFDSRMDDFSALVIYLSLLALTTQPNLWDKHVKRNARGQLDGNMLFSRNDFLLPDTSPIFVDLLHSSNAQVRDLAQTLKDACLKPNDGTECFPVHLLDPDYLNKKALKELEQAIKLGDDEQVVKLWEDALSKFNPAQPYQVNIAAARKRIAAKAALRTALATHDIFNISDAATQEALENVSETDRKAAALAIVFVQASRQNDENKMVDLWHEIQQPPYNAMLNIPAQERARLDQAEQRKDALSRFRIALYRHGSPKPKAFILASAYSDILNKSSYVTKKERELLNEVNGYIIMFNAVRGALQEYQRTGNIEPFQDAYDEELDKKFSDDFTDDDRRLIDKLVNQARIERALNANAVGLAMATVKKLEEDGSTIIADERLNKLHENFIKAYDARNLRVKFQHGKAYASWDWPADEHVQLSLVVWRYDHWPEHPAIADPGRETLWVMRRVYETYKCAEFLVGMAHEVYVQVYLAKEGLTGQTKTIYFSRGNEPTSRWSGLIEP